MSKDYVRAGYLPGLHVIAISRRFSAMLAPGCIYYRSRDR